MKSEFGVLALDAALARGLIDRLQRDPLPEAAVAELLDMAPYATRLLLAQLSGDGVIQRDGTLIRLTPGFVAALAARDLLEAKIAFLRLVLADLPGSFDAFLAGPAAFVEQSAVFELFRYDRAMTVTDDNVAATRRWVAYTTVLTRYEAEPAVTHPAFGGARRLLDIGGNSGEFALRACRAHPDLTATVFDLPVVCRIGAEHVAAEPEGERIRFVAGDMRTDPLPSGRDLISFKSVLHDWPDTDALHLLGRAARQLQPGGRLLVFERSRFVPGNAALPFPLLAHLPFLPFLRAPDFYVSALRQLGFVEITCDSAELDMPFHLVCGRKPG